MENKILDDHAAFNRWQVMEGMRINESGTEPSVYVTIVKLKKVFNSLDEPEIRRLFSKDKKLKKDRQLTDVGINWRKEKLIKKLETLVKEQLFTALNVYHREYDGELCARFVLACKFIRRDDE